MAGIFLRLKLTILSNRARRLRGDTARLRGLVIVAAILVWLALDFGPGIYDQLSTTGQLPEPDELLGMQSFSLVFLWIAMPLTFAGRRDLDLSAFQLLPLRPRQLVGGLASTWLLSPWVYLTGAGVVVGGSSFDPTTGDGVLMAVGGVGLVALCAIVGQVVITGADLLARQRRARDLLVVLSIVVAAAPVLLAIETAQRFDDPGQQSAIADAVSVLPPAWPGRAIAAAAAGDLAAAGLALAGTAALIAGCAWAWTGLVRRSMLAEDASTTRPERDRDPFARFGRWIGGRRGAVAAAEGRLLVREPGRLPNALIFSVFFGGMFTALAAAGYAGSDVKLAALGATALTIITIARRGNEIGMHAGALWQNVVAPGRAADDLVGRDLAALWVDGPLVAATAVGIAAFTGGWAILPGALVAGAAAILAAYAAMAVISVKLAQPQPLTKDGTPSPNSRMNPIVSLASMGLWMVALAPIFALMAVPGSAGEAWLAAAVPLALVYGVAVWWATHRVLGRWMEEHQSDLLNRLTR